MNNTHHSIFQLWPVQECPVIEVTAWLCSNCTHLCLFNLKQLRVNGIAVDGYICSHSTMHNMLILFGIWLLARLCYGFQLIINRDCIDLCRYQLGKQSNKQLIGVREWVKNFNHRFQSVVELISQITLNDDQASVSRFGRQSQKCNIKFNAKFIIKSTYSNRLNPMMKRSSKSAAKSRKSFSPTGRFPTTALKSKQHQQIHSSLSNTSSLNQLQSVSGECYFCHMKNAMYMGGMKSFEKNGKGIVIHDNGTSVLSCYYNDLRHGHNILMADNCLQSIMYTRNKVTECVFRKPYYLIYLKYNRDEQVDGKAVLLDYSTKSVYYATYRKGNLINKEKQTQYSVINRVFDLDNLQFLIGNEHAKVLRFEFDPNELIHHQKTGFKFNAGFYRQGLLNGLGLTVIVKQQANLGTHREGDDFCIKIIERGFFVNSKLHGMGQKWFKNGNLYVGDFKGDAFDGKGVLKNTLKKNWVYGYFQNGNMCDLLNYNHEIDNKKYEKIIEEMHQRKNSWIDKQVEVQSGQKFEHQIQVILNNNPSNHIKSLNERKQEVLRKIQENFMCDEQESSPVISSRHISSYHNFSKDGTIQQPNYSDFKGFAENFRGAHESSIEKRVASSRVEDRQQPLYELNTHQQNRRYYAPMNYQQDRNQKQNYSRNTNLLKLYEVPTTKESSARDGQRTSISPANNLSSSRCQSRKTSQPYKSNNKKPQRNQVEQPSVIRDEAPSFNIDSKRIIGRSRLFKYLNNDSVEEPPKFNYRAVPSQ